MGEYYWNQAEAERLKGLDELVYRSNLLGRDRSVANWGGGNTSMKSDEVDFRGRPLRVLWVKASGSDLATITRAGFAGLRLADVTPLVAREQMSDEEMTAYLLHCAVAPNMPRASIETLLHAFVPFAHIDHTHPDNIISLATAEHGESLMLEVFGDEAAWVPYLRPGFTLAKLIAQAIEGRPRLRAVIMAKHGLVTWGESSKECYDCTLDAINRAGEYLADRAAGRSRYGGAAVRPLDGEKRDRLLAQALPPLRGALSGQNRVVLQVDHKPDVVEFVSGKASRELALTGSACPDHLVHTKHWPLWVDFDSAAEDARGLVDKLRSGVASYREQYTRYFEENRQDGVQMDDPAPRVILIPGVGMITTGKEARFADISAQLYYRAIQVMRATSAVDRYVSLTPAEAFGVEYWPLERYKLSLLPPEKELARQVAFVTGGASGIGRAIAARLASEGAHVAIADINLDGAQEVARELVDRFGFRRALAVGCDVTDEQSVASAFRETVLTYGGVDLVVSNAGLASGSPIDETSLADWDRTMSVLGTGYFLVAREATRLLKGQGLGGSLIFIVSKNALLPGKNAAAYGAAKAAELNMARGLAEELGEFGIRVNSVLPDAVIQGSSIWTQSWRQARARSMGVHPDEIEEYYRQRSLLKVNVLPEDVAEAVLFLASPRASKTTGAVLSVDGGLAGAAPR